jgi:hypothetical protein
MYNEDDSLDFDIFNETNEDSAFGIKSTKVAKSESLTSEVKIDFNNPDVVRSYFNQGTPALSTLGHLSKQKSWDEINNLFQKFLPEIIIEKQYEKNIQWILGYAIKDARSESPSSQAAIKLIEHLFHYEINPDLDIEIKQTLSLPLDFSLIQCYLEESLLRKKIEKTVDFKNFSACIQLKIHEFLLTHPSYIAYNEAYADMTSRPITKSLFFSQNYTKFYTQHLQDKILNRLFEQEQYDFVKQFFQLNNDFLDIMVLKKATFFSLEKVKAFYDDPDFIQNTNLEKHLLKMISVSNRYTDSIRSCLHPTDGARWRVFLYHYKLESVEYFIEIIQKLLNLLKDTSFSFETNLNKIGNIMYPFRDRWNEIIADYYHAMNNYGQISDSVDDSNNRIEKLRNDIETLRNDNVTWLSFHHQPYSYAVISNPQYGGKYDRQISTYYREHINLSSLDFIVTCSNGRLVEIVIEHDVKYLAAIISRCLYQSVPGERYADRQKVLYERHLKKLLPNIAQKHREHLESTDVQKLLTQFLKFAIKWSLAHYEDRYEDMIDSLLNHILKDNYADEWNLLQQRTPLPIEIIKIFIIHGAILNNNTLEEFLTLSRSEYQQILITYFSKHPEVLHEKLSLALSNNQLTKLVTLLENFHHVEALWTFKSEHDENILHLLFKHCTPPCIHQIMSSIENKPNIKNLLRQCDKSQKSPIDILINNRYFLAYLTNISKTEKEKINITLRTELFRKFMLLFSTDEALKIPSNNLKDEDLYHAQIAVCTNYKEECLQMFLRIYANDTDVLKLALTESSSLNRIFSQKRGLGVWFSGTPSTSIQKITAARELLIKNNRENNTENSLLSATEGGSLASAAP